MQLLVGRFSVPIHIMANWNRLPNCSLVSVLSYLNKTDCRLLVLAAPCVSKQ